MDESPIREEIAVETVSVKKRRRRGKRRYTAPLGFLVLLFAVIGVVSTVVGAVKWVGTWNDDTALREELSLFLDPIAQLSPPAFTDAGEAEDQSTLVMSAIYSIAETERIRMLREKDDTCKYTLEETQWRMIVPKADVEAAFSALYGDKKIRTHQTVGEAEYDEKKFCYYVPQTLTTSAYMPVIDWVRERDDIYTVRVAYVSNADLEIDARGEVVPPAADMAKYAQRFTVRRQPNGKYVLLSVEDEAVK